MSSIATTRDAIIEVSSLALQSLFTSNHKSKCRPASRSSNTSMSSISTMSSFGSNNSKPPNKETWKVRLQLAIAILEAASHGLCIRRWEETTVAKCSQLPLVLYHFKQHDKTRFRRNLRIGPTTFDILCSQLLQHSVFTNRSYRNQLPIEFQVAIALYRFGHEGNGVSCESVAQWAGLSVGGVLKVTLRVIEAILSNQNAVRWVSEEEKEEAKQWVEQASGCQTWRDGYCMVDGTLIPLFAKPSFFGEAYFDRKSNYSLNVQLISLPNLRIIDYVVGHCGSAHDSTVFKDSRCVQEQQQLFTPKEWIWGDSAYTAQTWMVTPYKRPLSMQPDNRRFNYHLSKVRVRSEHAVGFLKGRFASLSGLRIQIRDADSHIAALSWIRACIILHTLIFWIENGHEDWQEQQGMILKGRELGGEDSDDFEEGPIRVQSIPSNQTLRDVLSESPALRKRNELKRALLSIS